MNFDLFGYVQKGGWAMYPLLGFLLLGLTFTFERLIVLFFQKRKLKPDAFLEAFDQSMKKHDGDKEKVIEEMTALCKKRGGVAAEIMLEGLQKYQHANKLNMSVFDMKQWLNDAIEERARIELPQLESHLGVISVVATVSPLLGLLGTVLGMIKSFTVMASAAGGAKPDELAGGISEALITTATGMIIAIPFLISYNAIKGAVENYVLLVEEAAIHLVDTLILDIKPQQGN